MCQQLIQFCSSSTRPLLFAGSLLSLLLAVAIGYIACANNSLYKDIDPTLASNKALFYYLQLAAAAYLTIVTIFSSAAAYYDQKHSIRALAVVALINFVLAVAAILVAPSAKELVPLFEKTLERASAKYNYTDRFPIDEPNNNNNNNADLHVLNSTAAAAGKTRTARFVFADQPQQPQDPAKEMTNEEATKIWDRLQARGCCGIHNSTTEWKDTIPKSCCSSGHVTDNNMFKCKQVDSQHSRACIELIEASSVNLLIVLALIALVNFYVALITGVNTYRTFHYNEASQSAYT